MTPGLAPLLALLLAAPARSAAPAGGTVHGLEVTSVTKTHLYGFLRTTLPAAAAGTKQSFRGEATAWGVKVPLKQPVQAMVQPAGSSFDVVFLVEVELSTVPAELLAHASVKSVALGLSGTLTGDGKSSAPVRAEGTLPFGPSGVKGPPGLGGLFARFTGGSLSGLSLSETRGEARLALLDPFSFDVPVREIRYQATAGGGVLASGTRTGIRVHRGRENEVALPIRARNAGLAAAALSAAKAGGTLEVRVSGAVTIRVGRGEDVVLPFDVNGKVEVLP